MNSLEKLLNKFNFKKIAVAYIIVTVVAAIACATTLGILFRERIGFAMQYSSLSRQAEKLDVESLKSEADKLAGTSADVVDILLLDSKNNVLYAAKNSEFASGQLNLTKTESNSNYLQSTKNSDVVFKYVKGKEFMLNSILNKDFGEVKDEYDDNSFYEKGFSDNTVYMLSYLGGNDSSCKIYIINNPTTVPYGITALKVTACVAMLLFMIYWVLLALWAYRDAAKSKLYPVFWGIIVLFTNLAGVIVYKFYKRSNALCKTCGAFQSKDNTYCCKCGEKLLNSCESCGKHILSTDTYCPHCGTKILK